MEFQNSLRHAAFSCLVAVPDRQASWFFQAASVCMTILFGSICCASVGGLVLLLYCLFVLH